MSDIIIKAGGTEIHAHKVVLAAHSASFKAMFQASHCARLVLFLPACLGNICSYFRVHACVLASALCHLLPMESMLWLESYCMLQLSKRVHEYFTRFN